MAPDRDYKSTTARSSGAAPRAVDVEDVDDIIGVASELKEAAADTLTVEELEDVGRELDIPAEYVRRAIEELERRRRQASIARARAVANRRRLIGIAVAVGVLIAGSLLITAQAGRSLLDAARSQAEMQRVSWRTALARQQSIELLYEGRPPTLDSDAERTGAENRVAVAKRRYDEAATVYNQRATSLPGRLALVFFDLPERLPLSDEANNP